MALISGGAGEIGEAVCRVFTAAGAQVLIADIDSERATMLARELPGARALCDIAAVRPGGFGWFSRGLEGRC